MAASDAVWHISFLIPRQNAPWDIIRSVIAKGRNLNLIFDYIDNTWIFHDVLTDTVWHEALLNFLEDVVFGAQIIDLLPFLKL